jgi:hypothetical protein
MLAKVVRYCPAKPSELARVICEVVSDQLAPRVLVTRLSKARPAASISFAISILRSGVTFASDSSKIESRPS